MFYFRFNKILQYFIVSCKVWNSVFLGRIFDKCINVFRHGCIKLKRLVQLRYILGNTVDICVLWARALG